MKNGQNCKIEILISRRECKFFGAKVLFPIFHFVFRICIRILKNKLFDLFPPLYFFSKTIFWLSHNYWFAICMKKWGVKEGKKERESECMQQGFYLSSFGSRHSTSPNEIYRSLWLAKSTDHKCSLTLVKFVIQAVANLKTTENTPVNCDALASWIHKWSLL